MSQAALEQAVDVLRAGHAVVQQSGRLVDEDHQTAVDHEPRCVVHHDRALAHPGQQIAQRLDRPGSGVRGPDGLHHRGQADGVHEVRAQHPVRVVGGQRQAGDRHRRGVDRDHGAGGQQPVEAAVQLGLGGLVLDDVLHHQVDGGQAAELGGERQRARCRGPAAAQPGQPPFGRHPLLGGGQGLRVVVVQDHLQAAVERGLGQAGADHAGSDDANGVLVQESSPRLSDCRRCSCRQCSIRAAMPPSVDCWKTTRAGTWAPSSRSKPTITR